MDKKEIILSMIRDLGYTYDTDGYNYYMSINYYIRFFDKNYFSFFNLNNEYTILVNKNNIELIYLHDEYIKLLNIDLRKNKIKSLIKNI